MFVDVDAMRTTANHHLNQQGLAYPTYYRALFPDLRNEFTAVAQHARDAQLACGPVTHRLRVSTTPGLRPSWPTL